MRNKSPFPSPSHQGRGKELNLVVDTTQKGELIFEIWRKRGRFAHFSKTTETLSEDVLVELKKFLSRNNITLEQIGKILVNPGPGAFSSTRTGVATANALALALNVPLAEWPSGKIKEAAVPKYDREPNITSPSPHPGPLRESN